MILGSIVICPEKRSFKFSNLFSMKSVSKSMSSFDSSLWRVGLPDGFVVGLLATSELLDVGLKNKQRIANFTKKICHSWKVTYKLVEALFAFVTEIAGFTKLGSTACIAWLRGLMGTSTVGDSVFLAALSRTPSISKSSSLLVTSKIMGPWSPEPIAAVAVDVLVDEAGSASLKNIEKKFPWKHHYVFLNLQNFCKRY